ncbi:hypothetical protein [Roseomonas sp. HF4]|uniref:hypothetical protein n=1 Tax=Roseomonas sp. HF4 TaxID=2562313 RepID=UPI0010C07322|nr:hypothetical protein [Roseomonas sp. HF4]
MRLNRRRGSATTTAPPDAAPPPVRLFRTLLVGAVGIALPMLLHAILLPALGEGSTPLFVAFLLSLLPATGVAFFCAGPGMLRIGYAMCIVVGSAFLSLGMNEARIFGAVPSLDAAAAPSRPAAAGFLLPRAAPRADLARTVEVRLELPRNDLRGRPTSPSRLRGRFTVLPVVGPDWTPAQPVPVVAVLEHGPDGVTHEVPGAPWDAGRGVLRLLPEPLRDFAVEEALRQAGWTAARGIVVGRWVADPRWARLDAAMPLAWLFAAALLCLALVVLSRHPWVAAHLDRLTEGSGDSALPLGRQILLGIAALTMPCLLALAMRHAEVDVGIMLFAIAFAVVPSLMITIGASRPATPIGVLIAGVILVVALPIGVAGRGTTPNGEMPALAGARWADVQEAMIVIGAGWLVWALLVILGRLLEKRGRSGASR